MTIAKTGNSIVDAQARRGKAASDASARKSARLATKNAKSKSSVRAAKFSARKSAGKAAAGRSGRGIVIKKAASGKNAAGLLRYAADDKTAELILSNCGDTQQQQARFMRVCAETNKIKKTVGHTIVALPPGEFKNAEEWRGMVAHITKELGIDDTYPFAAYLHKTDKGQDLHIAYSRVNMDGQILDDRNDKYLMMAVEQSTEMKFNLKLTMREDMKTTKENTPNLSLSEVRKAERTKTKPLKLVVCDAIRDAQFDKPEPLTFIKRLKDVGIIATPYVHNNEMRGFSFSSDGQSFKGKDVAAAWPTLEKGLNYEQDRDIAKLTIISREARIDTTGLESIAATEQRPTSEIQGASSEVEQPTTAIKIEKPTPAPTAPEKAELIRQNSVGVTVNPNDAVTLKLKKRQEVIDNLRKEKGDNYKLAQSLANKLERGDLYKQKLLVKEFMQTLEHKEQAQAIQIMRKHTPEFVPPAPAKTIENLRPFAKVDAIPERLRLADRYVEPVQSSSDYQLPTM